MRRVVEIGCGAEAGPFFEGADEHFIVDTDARSLESAYMRDIRLTPILGSAADLEFANSSVDTVLARNVFSDPALFLNGFEKMLQLGMMMRAQEEGLHEEVEKQLSLTQAQSGLVKGDIMREAARILRVGGQLIAVEQKNPKRAEEFFNKAAEYSEYEADFDLAAAFDIEQSVPLGDVTPPSYARAHEGPKTETWVATRK